jgi:hypothetical protein
LTLAYRDYVVLISFYVSFLTLLAIFYFGGRQLVRAAKRVYIGFDALPAFPSSEAPPEKTEAKEEEKKEEES